MLTATDILFYVLAASAVVSAFLVIFLANPIFSALFLALSMSVLGALFFTLEAYFVSVAQITVYAGAVMVLFVMVVMLFDLKQDVEEIFKISPLNVVKILSAALLCGFLIGSAWLGVSALSNNPATQPSATVKVGELEKSAPLSVAAEIAAEADSLNAELAPHRPEDEDLTSAEKDALVDQQTPIAVSETKNEKNKSSEVAGGADEFGSTASLSKLLFSHYVFAFEAVSLLLLIAIVGAVALARSKGGTHHVVR